MHTMKKRYTHGTNTRRGKRATSAPKYGPTLDGVLVRENIIAGFIIGHEMRVPLLIGDDGKDRETSGTAAVVGPALKLARAHAKLGLPTFSYVFRYRPPFEHESADEEGRETEFVFGTLSARAARLITQKEREVSRLIQSYWTNFAKTGNPNGLGLPVWEPVSDVDSTLVFDLDGKIIGRHQSE